MNIYGERLRELEDALDRATEDWYWWDGVLSLPSCRFCGAEGQPSIIPKPDTVHHAADCPRTVLDNDRIGYVRAR